MARIRSIKPEFPQSETIGALSRDARLLFIQLWTFVDDEGRARAASRMLASLLYPYDDDAPSLIDGWLLELEGAGCVVRYVIEGTTYIQVLNWLKHQKIDRPTPSRIPQFDESSRILASPRCSILDLGSRIKEEDLEVSLRSCSVEPERSPEIAVAAPSENEFQKWYSAYPRKQGVAQARKAWVKATKHVTPSDLLDATKSYRFASDAQFIPLPASWLNGQRWLDQHHPGDIEQASSRDKQNGWAVLAEQAMEDRLKQELAEFDEPMLLIN